MRDLIKKKMAEKGISAYRLHKITGVSESTLSLYLRGKTDIMYEQSLVPIMGVLGIKVGT